MGIAFSAQDDFPLNFNAPRTQLGLRYTATGSDLRNDMVIFPTTFSTPMGDLTGPGEDFRMSVILNLALGHGQVTLTSPDPHVQPLLEYRFLENDSDLDRLRDGVRLVVRLTESGPYQGIVKRRLGPHRRGSGLRRRAGRLAAPDGPDVAAPGRHLQDGPRL